MSPDHTAAQPIALVTGGTGFIGRHITDELLNAGWRVRLLVRNAEKARTVFPDRLHRIEIIECDLLGNIPSVAFIEIDTLVHAAGLVLASSKQEFRIANVDVTQKIAALSRIHSPKATFIHLSSLAAREPHLSAYAQSKRESETSLVKLFGENKALTILRLPVVYGPHDQQSFKLFQLLSKGFLLIPSIKNQRFSALHVGDVASLVRLLAFEKKGGYGIQEIADNRDDGYSWQDIKNISEHILDRRVRLIKMPKTALITSAGIVEFTSILRKRPAFLSRGKIREMCHSNWVSHKDMTQTLSGWAPKISLEEGFTRTFEWYKVNN